MGVLSEKAQHIFSSLCYHYIHNARCSFAQITQKYKIQSHDVVNIFTTKWQS